MIRIDTKEFEKAKKELEGIQDTIGPAINVVTARLINNAAREAKKEVIKRITEQYYLDKKPLKN